jgi:hypothetical protein
VDKPIDSSDSKPFPIDTVKSMLESLNEQNASLLHQLQHSEQFASEIRIKIIGVQHSQKAFTELLARIEPTAVVEPPKEPLP